MILLLYVFLMADLFSPFVTLAPYTSTGEATSKQPVFSRNSGPAWAFKIYFRKILERYVGHLHNTCHHTTQTK